MYIKLGNAELSTIDSTLSNFESSEFVYIMYINTELGNTDLCVLLDSTLSNLESSKCTIALF